MTYDEMWRSLTSVYDEGEAKAVAKLALEELFGLSTADIYSGKVSELSPKDEESLREITRRLAAAEPVQYVTGRETFCQRQFRVEPGVLIPRPETEELCRWALESLTTGGMFGHSLGGGKRVLDIGTGSGCIAITIALDAPLADVEAWDISPAAISTAKDNAWWLGAKVEIRKRDCLACGAEEEPVWDMIVSNPPYVCDSERKDMERNVLDYEPETALFVPDSDPLRFYKAIADYGTSALRNGGELYFEGNPAYTEDMVAMLRQKGYTAIETRQDQFGKERFVRARKEF